MDDDLQEALGRLARFLRRHNQPIDCFQVRLVAETMAQASTLRSVIARDLRPMYASAGFVSIRPELVQIDGLRLGVTSREAIGHAVEAVKRLDQ